MNFFNKLFRYDQQETTGQVLFFRLFEVVIVYQVLYYAWSWGFYIPQLGEVVLPLGIANYIDVSFMFNSWYSVGNAVIITVVALFAFFKQKRSFYIVALLAMHLQYAARFSQGEISHGSNLTAMALLMLALAGLFFSKLEEQRKVAFGLFVFFAGLGYTSAALCKLFATGPEWINGSHLYLWIGERAVDKLSQEGSFQLNLLQEQILEHHWMATMTLLFGLLTELFGFLIWFRKIRWIEGTLLIGMHLGIFLSMRIEFNSYLVILFLISYPWHKAFDHLFSRPEEGWLSSWLQKRARQLRTS